MFSASPRLGVMKEVSVSFKLIGRPQGREAAPWAAKRESAIVLKGKSVSIRGEGC